MFFLGPADPISCLYKIAGSSMQSHRHNHVDTCCMLPLKPLLYPKPIANTEILLSGTIMTNNILNY